MTTPETGPIEEPPIIRIEKDIRKIKKKIRECDAILEKQTKGLDQLTEAEADKIGRLPGWWVIADLLQSTCNENVVINYCCTFSCRNGELERFESELRQLRL